MKSYQQRMETSGIADRIALLAHDHLVQMYEGLGFEAKGKSGVRFAGGGWNSLVRAVPCYLRCLRLNWSRHMSLLNRSWDPEDGLGALFIVTTVEMYCFVGCQSCNCSVVGFRLFSVPESFGQESPKSL